MERYIVNIICLGLDSEKVRMRARWWGTSAEGFDGMMMMAVVNGITICRFAGAQERRRFCGGIYTPINALCTLVWLSYIALPAGSERVSSF